jgi:hypothetical protein
LNKEESKKENESIFFRLGGHVVIKSSFDEAEE